MKDRYCDECAIRMPPYIPRKRKGDKQVCWACHETDRGGYVSAEPKTASGGGLGDMMKGVIDHITQEHGLDPMTMGHMMRATQGGTPDVPEEKMPSWKDDPEGATRHVHNMVAWHNAIHELHKDVLHHGDYQQVPTSPNAAKHKHGFDDPLAYAQDTYKAYDDPDTGEKRLYDPNKPWRDNEPVVKGDVGSWSQKQEYNHRRLSPHRTDEFPNLLGEERPDWGEHLSDRGKCPHTYPLMEYSTDEKCPHCGVDKMYHAEYKPSEVGKNTPDEDARRLRQFNDQVRGTGPIKPLPHSLNSLTVQVYGGYAEYLRDAWNAPGPRQNPERAQETFDMYDHPGVHVGDDLSQHPHMSHQVGWVKTHMLDRHKEYDRASPNPTYGGPHSRRIIDAIKDDFKQGGRGILNPVLMEYHPESHTAYLGEGNHRLAAAKELGLPALPTRIVKAPFSRNNGTPVKGEQKMFPDESGYFPSTAHPADVLPDEYMWHPPDQKTSSIYGGDDDVLPEVPCPEHEGSGGEATTKCTEPAGTAQQKADRMNHLKNHLLTSEHGNYLTPEIKGLIFDRNSQWRDLAHYHNFHHLVDSDYEKTVRDRDHQSRVFGPDDTWHIHGSKNNPADHTLYGDGLNCSYCGESAALHPHPHEGEWARCSLCNKDMSNHLHDMGRWEHLEVGKHQLPSPPVKWLFDTYGDDYGKEAARDQASCPHDGGWNAHGQCKQCGYIPPTEGDEPCDDPWCVEHEPEHTKAEHIDPPHRDPGHPDYHSAEQGVEDAIGDHPDAWLFDHNDEGPSKYSSRDQSSVCSVCGKSPARPVGIDPRPVCRQCYQSGALNKQAHGDHSNYMDGHRHTYIDLTDEDRDGMMSAADAGRAYAEYADQAQKTPADLSHPQELRQHMIDAHEEGGWVHSAPDEDVRQEHDDQHQQYHEDWPHSVFMDNHHFHEAVRRIAARYPCGVCGSESHHTGQHNFGEPQHGEDYSYVGDGGIYCKNCVEHGPHPRWGDVWTPRSDMSRISHDELEWKLPHGESCAHCGEEITPPRPHEADECEYGDDCEDDHLPRDHERGGYSHRDHEELQQAQHSRGEDQDYAGTQWHGPDYEHEDPFSPRRVKPEETLNHIDDVLRGHGKKRKKPKPQHARGGFCTTCYTPGGNHTDTCSAAPDGDSDSDDGGMSATAIYGDEPKMRVMQPNELYGDFFRNQPNDNTSLAHQTQRHLDEQHDPQAVKSTMHHYRKQIGAQPDDKLYQEDYDVVHMMLHHPEHPMPANHSHENDFDEDFTPNERMFSQNSRTAGIADDHPNQIGPWDIYGDGTDREKVRPQHGESFADWRSRIGEWSPEQGDFVPSKGKQTCAMCGVNEAQPHNTLMHSGFDKPGGWKPTDKACDSCWNYMFSAHTPGNYHLIGKNPDIGVGPFRDHLKFSENALSKTAGHAQVHVMGGNPPEYPHAFMPVCHHPHHHDDPAMKRDYAPESPGFWSGSVYRGNDTDSEGWHQAWDEAKAHDIAHHTSEDSSSPDPDAQYPF